MPQPDTDVNAKKRADFFRKFLGENRTVIADPNTTSRAAIAAALNGLGAAQNQMSLVPNYTLAEAEIDRLKPKLVICDYDLERRCGLDLLQRQRAQNPGSKDSIFMLVTGNSSQSAVARAAEEDVDTFILKPFTAEGLKAQILRAALMKLNPPEYVKAIDQGKEELTAGKVDEAIATFTRAMSLDSSPSLACFYLGQANQMKKILDGAKGNYQQGLEYNKIHYKCMVGLFEVLMAENRQVEAYDVVKRISQYFPANPQRLTQVLRLAIVTHSYEDVERYYRLFTTIDERNPEMVRYVCAALVVCGRYYLMSNNNSRAIELLQKAAITAGSNTRLLREIILALVEAESYKQAVTFLKRFPPETQSSQDYLAMELLVASHVAATGLVIEKGRGLLNRDIHDPAIYQVLIRKHVEAGLQDTAEDLAQRAAKRWPDQEAAFKRNLQTKPTAPSAKA